MTFVLRVDSDENIAFANKLEKIHRSALPSAIRNTLNQAAITVKKETLLESAKSNFKERQPNFFKANSKVDFAKGFNVNSMESVVGMFSNKLKSEDNYAVKNLEQQEEGGTVGGKAFIPQKAARISGWRVTKKKYRIADMTKNKTKVFDSEDNKSDKKSQQWIKTAIHAGVGSIVLGNHRGKKGRVGYEITGISNVNGFKIKQKAVFSVQGKREINIKPTHFMKEAALPVAGKMDKMFYENAKFQIEKYLR